MAYNFLTLAHDYLKLAEQAVLASRFGPRYLMRLRITWLPSTKKKQSTNYAYVGEGRSFNPTSLATDAHRLSSFTKCARKVA